MEIEDAPKENPKCTKCGAIDAALVIKDDIYYCQECYADWMKIRDNPEKMN